MSGFYKRAVVWLGLNEEYPEDIRGGVADERGPDGPAADAVSDAEAPERSEQPRQERPGPAPQAKPERPPRVERSRPIENPLGQDASRDRAEGSVRVVPIDTPATGDAQEHGSIAARGAAASSPVRAASDMSTATVRAVPMPSTVTPEIIVPLSFNDAQNVADFFREGTPAIVNLQNAERDLARRLIDFSSGLCYGLDGRMEKVAKDVYLLIPADVEVAEADRTKY